MNYIHFIARKILAGNSAKRNMSRPIIRIAIGGIALGIAVMILTICIVVGFQKEIKNKVIGFGSHITITNNFNNNSLELLPIDKNDPTILDLKNNPEIKSMHSFATKGGIVKTKIANEGIILKGIDGDYDWTFIKKNLLQGKVPNFDNKNDSDGIVISNLLCKRLGFTLNDRMVVYFLSESKKTDSSEYSTFEKRFRNFTIKAIYETGLEDFDAKSVFVDIKQVQSLNYWEPNQVAGIELEVKNIDLLDTTGAIVYQSLSGGLNSQTIKETNDSIFSWLGLMDYNAIIIITLMIIVAAINMISALLILILERTTTIGILKALGSANRDVMKIFIYQAVYLISRGLIIGNVIGIGLALLQLKFKFFTLNKETYYVSEVPIDFNILNIVLLNLGTFLICSLMMLLPAIIITKITPVKAIRFS